MTNIKEALLKTNIFIHNTYFEKYIKLIENNKDSVYTKYISQRHHIIPRFYLRVSKQIVEDNLVILTYGEHVLAHYYLLNCVKDEFYKSAKTACLRLNQPNLTVDFVENNVCNLNKWYYNIMSTAYKNRKKKV